MPSVRQIFLERAPHNAFIEVKEEYTIPRDEFAKKVTAPSVAGELQGVSYIGESIAKQAATTADYSSSL